MILHSPFSSTMTSSGGFSSFSIAHGFSCASCTEVGSGSGSTASTAGRTVTSASTAEKIADSNKQSFRTDQNESFASLQAFNNALQEQKPGSVKEMMNGTRMLVLYEPVQFHTTTWAVFVTEALIILLMTIPVF